METLGLLAVVQNYIKTTRHRNNELMQVLVRMRAPIGPPRHIVQVVDPLDVEGDVVPALYEGQVAPWISDLGQLYDFAVSQHNRDQYFQLVDYSNQVANVTYRTPLR